MEITENRLRRVDSGQASCDVCGNVKPVGAVSCRVCGNSFQESARNRRHLPSLAGVGPGRGRIILLGVVAWFFLKGSPGVAWTHTLESGEEITTSAVYGEDLVFFGDSEGIVHALEADDGSERWRFQTSGGPVTQDLLVARGRLFVVSGQVLHALDLKSGHEQWSHEDPRGFGRPLIEGNEIILATGGSIRAINQASGKAVWEFDAMRGDLPETPLVTGDTIYFGFITPVAEGLASGGLYAVDLENASLVWRTQTNTVVGQPILDAGLVIAVHPDPQSGEVFAVEQGSGELRWRTAGVTTMLAHTPGRIHYARQFAVMRGQSEKGEFGALDARNGDKIWSRTFLGSPVSNPCTDGERVYLGLERTLKVLEAETGDDAWSAELPGTIRHVPFMADDHLYLNCGGTHIVSVRIH